MNEDKQKLLDILKKISDIRIDFFNKLEVLKTQRKAVIKKIILKQDLNKINELKEKINEKYNW